MQSAMWANLRASLLFFTLLLVASASIGGEPDFKPPSNHPGARPPAKKAPDVLIHRSKGWYIGYAEGGSNVMRDGWVPLHLQITNNTKVELKGTLTYKLSDQRYNDRFNSTYTRKVLVPPHKTTKRITTMVYVPKLHDRTPEDIQMIQASLVTESHGIFDKRFDANALMQFRIQEVFHASNTEDVLGPVEYHQSFFLFLSKESGFALPMLRPQSTEIQKHMRKYSSADIKSLPGHWTGYSSVTGVVWDGIDIAKMAPLPVKALQHYVEAGGHLIIAVGQNRTLIERSFLKTLLPCQFGPNVRNADLAKSVLGLERDLKTVVPSLVPSASAQPLAYMTAHNGKRACIAVRGDYGAGAITVLSFSMTEDFFRKSMSSNVTRQRWNRWIDPILHLPHSFLTGQTSQPLRLSTINSLRHSSTRRIPTRFEILSLLLIYLIILVPIPYLIFKRLDRLEYAWFAIPLLAFAFFGYSYRVAFSDLGQTLSVTDMNFVRLDSQGRGSLLHLGRYYNPSYSTFDVSFTNRTAAPLYYRVDNLPSLHGMRHTYDLQFLEDQGEIMIKDLDIGFDSSQPMECSAVRPFAEPARITVTPITLSQPFAKSEGEYTTTIKNQSELTFFAAALVDGTEGLALRAVGAGYSGKLPVPHNNSNRQSLDQIVKYLAKQSKRPAVRDALVRGIESLIGKDDRPFFIGLTRTSPLHILADKKQAHLNSITIVAVPCSVSGTTTSSLRKTIHLAEK